MKHERKQEIARHIAGVVICTIIVAAMSITALGCKGDQVRAETQAWEWCRKVGARSVSSVACVGRDSDGDGYITCTLGYENGSHEEIECAYGIAPWDTGCRERLPKPVGSERKL